MVASANGNLETERRGGNSQSVPTKKHTSKKKGGSNTARKLRSLKGANPDDSQLYYGQEEIESVHQDEAKYALSSQKPSGLLRKRRVQEDEEEEVDEEEDRDEYGDDLTLGRGQNQDYSQQMKAKFKFKIGGGGTGGQ